MNPIETTIAICGHVKHGKSTLAGRLIFELGGITREQIEKKWQSAPQYIREFEKNKKDFNKFNYIFLESRSATFSRPDKFDDQSRTAFPSRGSIAIGDQRITIVDEPGHLKYIDNIVYGIYLANLGVVVVDALDGIQDSTIQMVQLLSFFDIPIIAICVTKMDRVGFSKMVFDEISLTINEKIIQPFLNYHPPIIPVCALIDFNQKLDKEFAWYNGKGLVQIIKEINVEEQAKQEITRCAVKEVFNPQGISTVLVGVLETGTLNVNDDLVLEPASYINRQDILLKPRSLQQARAVNEPRAAGQDSVEARSIVALAFPGLSVRDAKYYLRHGGMLGSVENRPSVANQIIAEVIFFQSHKVYNGKKYSLLANSADAPAKIVEIIERIEMPHSATEPTRGEIIKAKFDLENPICIETDNRFGRLNRFALRESNEVIGCGRCLSVVV